MSAKLVVKKDENGPNLKFIAWPLWRMAILLPSVMATLVVCIKRCCRTFCTPGIACCFAAEINAGMLAPCMASFRRFAWKTSKSLSVAFAMTRKSCAKVFACFMKKPFVLCSTWSFRTVSTNTAANSGVFHRDCDEPMYRTVSDARWYSSSSRFIKYRNKRRQLILAGRSRLGAQSP